MLISIVPTVAVQFLLKAVNFLFFPVFLLTVLHPPVEVGYSPIEAAHLLQCDFLPSCSANPFTGQELPVSMVLLLLFFLLTLYRVRQNALEVGCITTVRTHSVSFIPPTHYFQTIKLNLIPTTIEVVVLLKITDRLRIHHNTASLSSHTILLSMEKDMIYPYNKIPFLYLLLLSLLLPQILNVRSIILVEIRITGFL